MRIKNAVWQGNLPNYRERASATLEATLVIPLYVYAVLSIMFVIRLINVYLDVDRAAYNTARELSKYAYEYNESGTLGILKGQLYTSFISDIGAGYGKEAYVVGGTAGFNLTGSSICDDGSKVRVQVSYIVKNPFDIFGLGLVHVKQGVVAEAWLGEDMSTGWEGSSESGNNNNGNDADSDGNGNDDKEEEKQKVYVTPWGRVYHTDADCSAINLSIQAVSSSGVCDLRNASGGKYYPCESCGENADGTVYITDYGDRYHTDRNCSGLKRTVEEVSIDEVGDMTECKRCGKSHAA
jgi:hypothetical protein